MKSETIQLAERALNRLNQQDTIEMREQIADTAEESDDHQAWEMVFSHDVDMISRFKEKWQPTTTRRRFTGFVVSKGGTFGIPIREYLGANDIPMVVIQWGPFRWVTPVYASDVIQLKSRYHSVAFKEAKEILDRLESKT